MLDATLFASAAEPELAAIFRLTAQRFRTKSGSSCCTIGRYIVACGV
jgi:hypothetical protein